MTMLKEAKTGQLKALYVVGENPVASLPVESRTTEALGNLDFLVCQELFLTETAKLAHVVLPACSYAEKDGTFLNHEGHMQNVRKAIDPIGEGRPDWEVFSALSGLMGHSIEYSDVKKIGKEIRSLIPESRTLGPSPVPVKPNPEAMDRYLHGGYREDLESRFTLPPQSPKSGDTLALIVTQSLFHSGKFSTRAQGLLQIQSKGCLSMNPTDGTRLGIEDGDTVRVSNALGEAESSVKLLDRVPEGVMYFPEHFDGDIRRLLRVSVDPHTEVPYFKATQVKLEKVGV